MFCTFIFFNTLVSPQNRAVLFTKATFYASTTEKEERKLNEQFLLAKNKRKGNFFEGLCGSTVHFILIVLLWFG